ncbi:MAG: hypothetical protein HPY52_12335 [Firmicutes bacterium]|nr:hypothetical protein [Bacillota bacterium]
MDSVRASSGLDLHSFGDLPSGVSKTYLKIGQWYLDLANKEGQPPKKLEALGVALDAFCQAKRLGAGATACAMLSDVLASYARVKGKELLEVRWFADRAILEAEEGIAMEPNNPLSYLALSRALTVRARLCPEWMILPLLLKAAMAYDVARKLQHEI